MAELDWADPSGALGCYIDRVSGQTLESYRSQPILVDEHANQEQDTAYGGYRHRQLFELVQNSADALSPFAGGGAASEGSSLGGRIEVRLVDEFLYCADDGVPIDEEGVKALMFSRLSTKRATGQIGTFGLGFKSVLGVSDSPEFFSRSGSFRFDASRSRERVQAEVQGAVSVPVLRLPEPFDPAEYRQGDDALCELMGWATNIVRLPLKPGAYEDLHRQMTGFPAEFLLFVKHVTKLTLTDDTPVLNRVLALTSVGDRWRLRSGDSDREWKLFKKRCRLSENARADQRPGDPSTEVKLWWAAPLDRLEQPGQFWAYFPTQTPSLVAGILNAPWKTNEDRQNLLPGTYNDELIDAAAQMIAEELGELATGEDPARHLDALPRERREGDSGQAHRLRSRLFWALHESAILPDQDGTLQTPGSIQYAPKLASDQRAQALDLWASHVGRPRDWLHHKALTTNRMGRVARLLDPEGEQRWRTAEAPRASVAEWLEALVQAAPLLAAVEASKTAIRIAALMDGSKLAPNDFGEIVWTESGTWKPPDPDRLFLPYDTATVGSSMDPHSCVHPKLASEREMLSALRKLGLREPSPASHFKQIAERVLQDSGRDADDLTAFWIASRGLSVPEALDVINKYGDRPSRSEFLGLSVQTVSGGWMPPNWVLLPGSIVPGDGSRDPNATVDMDFHGQDRELLTELGLTSEPQSGRDLSDEWCFREYRDACERQYRTLDLPSKPQHGKLDFTRHIGVGPLQVLMVLSDGGNASYTDALLMADACFEPLVMWHTGSNKEKYPKEKFDSLAVHMIRQHGRIRTAEGIVPFADALGDKPANTDALLCLLRHPKADKIARAFELVDPEPEFFGEHDPVPLVDVWPGLKDRLDPDQKSLRLIRCDRIRVGYQDRDCLLDKPDIYLARGVQLDEAGELEVVAQQLGLALRRQAAEEICERRTPAEIEERRALVRRHSTDAQRLLAAVGEQALQSRLPDSLLEALTSDGQTPTDIDIAEAAIATYHSDALRQFKHSLAHLDPPKKWAGSRRAVDFVRSLGFSEEWAGEQNRKRLPYLEVDGPTSLPPLHDYQQFIATRVRDLLRGEGSQGPGQRRGMISMPTGSGKTRVAVQAIVEAMRDDGLRGGVLWVADRDELCEQAVEAWRQVWASIGTKAIGAEAARLRISRMWGNQTRPQPTSERHVVVATIQTAHRRLSALGTDYDFLRHFKLVVFDEAHRSIAPTSTSVLAELGLTYRRRADEPYLLGLTATPYRGHDESETARLVRRYGSNRLDSDAFECDDPQVVIEELQSMKVLARADHQVIDGGTFQLGPEELDTMQKFVRGSDESDRRFLHAWLPPTAEDRIARDAQRTKRIIDAYETNIEPSWSTLIFAISVEHAQTVAALLNRKGIKARAVSGETDDSTRRRVVEEFRSGEIKALVNYAVFREGFDAPMTRAIIVARPVYSPNLYFQMVGRGLRGSLNGGSDRCLILNVQDNIENFSRALAFSELDWLWAK